VVFGLTVGRASDTHGSWDKNLTAEALSGRDHGSGGHRGDTDWPPDDATAMGHWLRAYAHGAVRLMRRLGSWPALLTVRVFRARLVTSLNRVQ